VRTGRVVLVGAPPGADKTALVLPLAVGVLQHNPSERLVVGNVEMAPADLLARVVARLAGVPVANVAEKTYAPGEKDRVRKAMAAHADALGRLAFLDPPHTLDRLAAALDRFGATLAVVDYLQRFAHGRELRESLDGLMSGSGGWPRPGPRWWRCRRSPDRRTTRGGRPIRPGLASFRGSAELEYGADSAYILDAQNGAAVLRREKMRYGKRADVHLQFDAAPGPTRGNGKRCRRRQTRRHPARHGYGTARRPTRPRGTTRWG
jgi:replicative DNA helicase